MKEENNFNLNEMVDNLLNLETNLKPLQGWSEQEGTFNHLHLQFDKSFIGEPQWINPYPDNLNPIKVKILRPCMFFAVDQKITIDKLGEYFTIHAINKLVNDGFIKYI